MKLTYSVLLLLAIILNGCKKDNPSDDPTPAPGTTRSNTVDVTWHKEILTANTGNWAVWTIAKFPVDNKAKSYKVRFFGFKGTFSAPADGYTFSWKAGDLPPTPYNVYPNAKDIKDGFYYLALDRTWCGGPCPESKADEFIDTYKKGYGAPKAEVTYLY